MSYTNYNMGAPRNKITCKSFLEAEHLFTPTATQKHALGRILEIDDATGRMWRYCKAGAVGLSKALVNSSAALDAQAITSTAQTAYGAAAGSTKFDVLLTTGNAWTKNALVDGWLLVSDGGTAMGDLYMIKSNKWTTSDTVMNVEIVDEGGLRNAIAATDDVILFQSKCANTVVSATNPISPMTGVSLVDVTATYYYWDQFRGYAPILTDDTDTVVVGDVVTLSDSVAGTIHLNDALTDDVPVGILVHSGATGEPSIVDLMIP